MRRTQNTLTEAGTVPYSNTHSTAFCSCAISLPHFQPLLSPCKFPSFLSQHSSSLPTLPQGVGGWYLLCTEVCVIGLYTITLICGLWHTFLAKSLLWLDPAGWTPAVAPVCTCEGFRRAAVGSCCPFLVGAGTELKPGSSVLGSDWLSWTFSLCTCSFGRLFDFFSRIICRTEKLFRLTTAIQQKNKTPKQSGILTHICNLFYRVSNK